MSQAKKKYVGKQISRKKYRRVRYDLIILGLVLVVSGILVYNIVSSAQPPSGSGVKKESPSEVLKAFVSESGRKNESIILVYKVRGDLPADSFTLGTLDYAYIYIGKEVTTSNESSRTTYTSFIYASQGPLYVVAEVLGLGFRSEGVTEVFFNPHIMSTWINVTTENLGERVVHSSLLGEVKTSSQLYRFYRTIEGKVRHVEVLALRLVDFGYIPVRVEASVDESRFVLELVDLKRLS